MKKHYHFIGIGGTGLSAIARVLLERGNIVSGSDMILSPLAMEIQQLGAVVYEGHHAEQVAGADVVIRSSAIGDDNVEVIEARAQGIPVYKRIDFLQQLTTGFQLIAVAGTHGKTTTTAMTAWVLEQLGLDPSYIIGGTSKDLHSNAHAGRGKYFVIEADEYDFMFLGLTPNYLIITNIEHDHPDCYPTREAYQEAFRKLVRRMPSDGLLLVCADSPSAYAIGNWAGRYVTVKYYGTNPSAQYQIANVHHEPYSGVCFDMYFPNGTAIYEKMSIPGNHNALNAGAVLALLSNMSLSPKLASQALTHFSGTGRRFDILGAFQGVTLIDDYGHHPTEIHSTVQAARARFPHHRLITVWQPHTYSRTQQLFNDYLDAFEGSDVVIVTEIYASREKLQDYSSELIASQIHHPDVHFIASLSDVTAYLLRELKSGDVVLVLSAGDANQINQDLAAAMSSSPQPRRKNA